MDVPSAYGNCCLIVCELKAPSENSAKLFFITMAKSKHKGYCKICGGFGELTFEHMPPRSAFNEKGVLLHSLNYINDAQYQVAKKKPTRLLRRGLGDYSLCGRCNESTGGWYGRDYLNWAEQAMGYIDVVEKSQVIYVPFRIRPLAVLKQIVSIGLSGSTSGSRVHEGLARFVLDPSSRSFPWGYACYVYLTNKKSDARLCSEMAMMNVETGTMDHILAEVALPPLGCVIVQQNTQRRSQIVDVDLCIINRFADYDYKSWDTVYLKIPIHRIWSPTALDYRRID